jgi:tRNA nucleotidyltransferase/poly(A) polymerase
VSALARRLASFAASQPGLARARAIAGATGCRLYLVGGAVRDAALARPAGDFDFILAGPPRSFLRRLARELGHRVVTFRKRGIVDHRIRAGEREWDFVEAGRRALRAEILRRDFTINAVAIALADHAVLDPAGGLRDLARRRLRAVKSNVFRDDPLRMLRAVRLRAEIGGLALERRTRALIRRDAALLARVSPERIKAEIDRMLAAGAPSASLRLLDRLGLLGQVVPELDPLRGLVQNRYHHLDAFEHTLAAVEAADDLRGLARGLPRTVFLDDPLDPAVTATTTVGRTPDRISRARRPTTEGRRAPGPVSGWTLPPARARLLRWALLLHDAGKAGTRKRGEDGEWHFFMHEEASRRIAASAMRRLRASRAEIAGIERLVALHLRLSIPASGGMTPRALRRIVREAGSLTPLLVLHSLADKSASRGAGHARTMARLRGAGRDLLAIWRAETERARRLPRLADGNDVMRLLGIPPGPRVGEILAEIDDLQASGELGGRDAALAWIARRHP